MINKNISVEQLEALRGATLNFDIETKYWIDEFSQKKVKFVQFGTLDESQKYRLNMDEISQEIKEKLFEVYQTWSIIGSNLQFDMGQIMYNYGVMPKEVFDDTYILARMLQEPEQGLKALVAKYLQIDKPEFEFTFDPVTKEIDYSNPLIDEYCEYDITTPNKLAEVMKSQQIIVNSNFIYRLEKKMAWIAARSEAYGIKTDLTNYDNIQQQLAEEIAQKQQKLNEMAGKEINPGSSKQVATLLYEDMGLECKSVTKKGTKSVDAKALFHLKGNPVVDLITDLKSQKSIQSTLANLPNYTSPEGLCHVNMKLIGYDGTSRIYNDPSITSLPKIARSMFVAREGHRLVYLDLKSAELFLAMVDAKQQDFIDSYNAGADPHTFTASKVFDKPESEIGKNSYERAAAKVVNFATMYGGTGYTIAKDLNVSEIEGEGIQKSWFDSYPQITNKFNQVKRYAMEHCITKTPFGRARTLANRNGYLGSEQIRQSVNTRYQSGVADCIKIAMTKLNEKNYNILTSVFDSILLEVPNEIPFETVKADVEDALDFSKLIPQLKFRFEIAEGQDWKSAYEKC